MGALDSSTALGMTGGVVGGGVGTWGTHPLSGPGLHVGSVGGAVSSSGRVAPGGRPCAWAGCAAPNIDSPVSAREQHGGTVRASALGRRFWRGREFVPHGDALTRATVVDPCSPDDAATSSSGAMRSTCLSLWGLDPCGARVFSHRPRSGRGIGLGTVEASGRFAELTALCDRIAACHRRVSSES